MSFDVQNVLARILPLAAAVGRGVRKLAVVAAAAASAIVLTVLLRWTPDEARGWVALVALAVVLAAPPAILFAFSLAVGELVRLPERLRGYPGTTRERADELGAIAREARSRARPAWRRLPSSTWRLARLVRSSRDLLAPHAPLLPLVSVPFLAATFVSALATPLLALAALVVVLVAVA